MLAERKLKLKQKMSAIKIQKYWRARYKRRKMRLDKLKYDVSIKRIQRWFKSIYYLIKNKQKALEVGQNNIKSVIKIQKNYRNHKN